MFHPVIAVDSAKKAMEFLGLKDGGGKVTTAEPPASLDPHSFQFQRPSVPGRHPILPVPGTPVASWSFAARGRSSAWAPAPPVGDPVAQRSAPGRAVPYGPRVCACARDDGFCSPPLFRSPLFMAVKQKKKNCLCLPSVFRLTHCCIHKAACLLFSANAHRMLMTVLQPH